MFRIFILSIFLISSGQASVNKKVIESSEHQLIIKIQTNVQTHADLIPTSLLIGLPDEKLPTVQIQYLEKLPLPFALKKITSSGFEWINQQKIRGLETGILSISPLANQSEYYSSILLTLSFQQQIQPYKKPNQSDITFLKHRIQNWNVAKDWFKRDTRSNPKIVSIPSGDWYKFLITEDGVTSISGQTILNALQINEGITSDRISIFMSQEFGRPRTHAGNQPMAENLVEIPIFIDDNDDGEFNFDDKIIFYGRGPSGFDINGSSLSWTQNVYFNQNTCWLLISDDNNHAGKRIQSAQLPSSIQLTLDYGIETIHMESDLVNLEASGTEWLGSAITSGGSSAILTQLGEPKNGVDVEIITRLRGHSLSETSPASHSISIHYGSLNGPQIGSMVNWSGSASRTITAQESDLDLQDGTNIFYIKNSSSNGNSSPYMDYFELEYGRKLSFDGPYSFSSPINNQSVRFSFEGSREPTDFLWDISQIDSVINIPFTSSNYADVSLGTSLQQFTLFNQNEISEIQDIYPIENANFESLRQSNILCEYIILGPKEFESAANEILSLRMPSIYAPIETVYQEFSAGNPDPMAIRSFVQWTQENWQSPSPMCMLLLGDGGYDYRNITGESSIIVPTIQVQGSRSYATDDRLVSISGNIPSIATGRFPAKNISEVESFVEKVVAMETTPEYGPWRQTVTLVADDAARPEPNHGSISIGKSHTQNNEEIAEIIPDEILVEKIYMMEYPEVPDPSAYGVVKPDATEALFNQLEAGTAILSYIGHGSPYQLAQEKLLHMDRGDINKINTGMKLPLWIVGTCSFGHFDDPLTESFSEELIREPMNGAGMVISTSRPITVSGNERYTKDLFETIFANDSINQLPAGVILQAIKDGTSEGQYFHLFGDPGMKLPLPSGIVPVQSITPDTLETLSTATFQGESNLNSNGNGYVILNDADRSITREYTVQSQTYSLSYNLPGATLFRGQFSVDDQLYSGMIRIPQDISYSNDPASLSVYIHNNETDAVGALSGIHLRGGDGTTDNYGPTISFETESGKILESGDHINKGESLLIRLSDPLGINLTNEIGHEIVLTDPLSNNSEIITDYFLYDQNSIQTGTINYGQIQSNGIHFVIKAWDNANNPSEKEIKLETYSSTKLRIFNAYNFPNPFSSFTQFTFEITKPSNIKIDVFSLSGRRIKSFESTHFNHGFYTIDWDGLDHYGSQIANGVYLYRIQAESDGTKETYIGRCSKFQ